MGGGGPSPLGPDTAGWVDALLDGGEPVAVPRGIPAALVEGPESEGTGTWNAAAVDSAQPGAPTTPVPPPEQPAQEAPNLSLTDLFKCGGPWLHVLRRGWGSALVDHVCCGAVSAGWQGGRGTGVASGGD